MSAITTPPSSFTPTPPPPPPFTETISQNFTNLGVGYAIAIALAFLVLLSTILLTSYICCRSRRRNNHPHDTIITTTNNGIYLPRIIFVAEDDDEENNTNNQNGVVGLEQAVLNSYPKFTFSKDRCGVTDSMCSICLCEYKDSEMLRLLPDCKHYFHLMCIDAWLKLNASCPVCRNSPLPTPLSTPLQEVVPLSQYSDGRRR